MHIKRKTIPRFWPIQRTGTTYVAVPSHNPRKAVPLIMIMRDLLKIVKTKKELKKLINEKKIRVNGKIANEINYPVALFDSISMPSAKKAYRTTLESKKMILEPIEDNEASTRFYKVTGKKILPGKKAQINMTDGRNILHDEKISTGDFALVDNAKNKIIKIVSLEKGAKVLIIEGKHAGKRGQIKEITKEGENSVAKIKSGEGEISTNITNLFIEE